MCQFHPLLLGDDGGGHGGGQVIDDDDDIGGVGLEVFLKLGHHAAGKFVEAGTVHAHEDVGPAHLQVVEERLLQRLVILTAGIHQLAFHVVPLLTRLVDGPCDGGHLDEVGPGPGYDAYFHGLLLKRSLMPPRLPRRLVAS